MNTPEPEPTNKHLAPPEGLQSPAPNSHSDQHGTVGKGPVQSPGQILTNTCNLLAHFNRMLRGWSRSYCHSRQFDNGAVATVVFKHFRNATLRMVFWESPCRSKNLLQKRCCDRELRTWLAETEVQEVIANHFQFHHDGSLICDLGIKGTIIFPTFSVIRKKAATSVRESVTTFVNG